MGYTHYWYQKRAFTAQEWAKVMAEASRIIAKAMRGYYAGPETAETAANSKEGFCRDGFAEKGAWRTFSHPEVKTPEQGKAIALCGSSGDGPPEVTADAIALNGSTAKGEDYESFILERAPAPDKWRDGEPETFECCKTEYRPYDAVVVSILAAAVHIAPEAIRAESDGGPTAIRLVF